MSERASTKRERTKEEERAEAEKKRRSEQEGDQDAPPGTREHLGSEHPYQGATSDE